MYDLHCHYLPGVDDGAASMQEALRLAAAAVDNGIVGAVLTPHVHPGRYDNVRSTLLPQFEAMRAALAQAGIPLQIKLGSEVRLLPESLELLAAEEIPTLGKWYDEPVVLLEFSPARIPFGAQQAVLHLRARGYVPMIAHPERNKELIADPRKLEPFVRAGCLVQLTAASVCGLFGAAPLQASLAFLESGWTTVVASDAHNLEHRPPVMAQAREALAARYGPQAASMLTYDNPRAIFGE